MNINAVTKHYDKLSARERFALLHAANVRGDEADRSALIASAPRKRWEVPTTRGLGSAFEWLAMFHMLMQLGYAASMNHLLTYDDPGAKIGDITQDEILSLILRRILESRGAWRAVCKEYGVDPDSMLDGLPFVEAIQLNELTAQLANESNPIELTDLAANIETYRAAIETKRKEWE